MSNCNSNTMPLSVVEGVSTSTCTNGCSPKEINVICKKIIIPYGQETLAIQGENDNGIRYFLVPKTTEDNVDLTSAKFYIITKISGEDPAVVEITNIEELDNYMKIGWDITNSITKESGTIQIQIVAKVDDIVWTSYPATFNIASGLYYDGLISSGNTPGGDTKGLNIFTQVATPETFEGVWIKSDTYSFDSIVTISNESDRIASSINFLVLPEQAHSYSTILFNSEVVNGLEFEFDDIFLTDEDNNIIYSGNEQGIEIYYGNGTEWINITPSQIRWTGVRYNFSTGEATRLGETDVNKLKCYSGRRRCNLNKSGEVTAYYGDENYDATGGGEVQIMVEQPAVYYKITPTNLSDNNNIIEGEYCVADGPMEGYTLHPAFTDDIHNYSKIYNGCFEGTRNTVSAYDYTIGSYATKKTSDISNQTRSYFRQQLNSYYDSSSSGWMIQSKQMYDLDNLLMAIEYMSFDFRNSISYGVTNSSSAQAIGQDYKLDSNGTGMMGIDKTISAPFTWRWKENHYGNYAEYVDGINVTGGNFYVSNQQSSYGDKIYAAPYYVISPGPDYVTSGSYTAICYFKYSSSNPWIFMAGENISATQHIGGNFYGTRYSDREFFQGGFWNDETRAGGFNAQFHNSFPYINSAILCRLAGRFAKDYM